MATRGDDDLVMALQRDLRAAFPLLTARYMQPIYWHIRRMVVTHADAQDATQETLVRVFRSFHQFEGKSTLKVWIYRIATNEALRIIGQRRGNELSIDAPEANANTLMADGYTNFDDLEAVQLQQAILALPTKQQLAFNLRYYDELDYESIAQITGQKAASVKANYHLAKEKIIKHIKSIN